MTHKTQDKNGIIAKTKDAINEHSLKIGVAATASLLSTPALAAIDVTSVTAQISGLDDPINKIGAALLGISVVILGWRLVRSVVR